jgi:hypothetical protein
MHTVQYNIHGFRPDVAHNQFQTGGSVHSSSPSNDKNVGEEWTGEGRQTLELASSLQFRQNASVSTAGARTTFVHGTSRQRGGSALRPCSTGRLAQQSFILKLNLDNFLGLHMHPGDRGGETTESYVQFYRYVWGMAGL